MKGLIYNYISPCGNIYIGQTRNEEKRRDTFLNENEYAGKKINEERVRYPNFNEWKYNIVLTIDEENEETLSEKLDAYESYYMVIFDSINDGLNISFGCGKISKNNYFIELYRNSTDDIKKSILTYLYNFDKIFYSSLFWINEFKKYNPILYYSKLFQKKIINMNV